MPAEAQFRSKGPVERAAEPGATPAAHIHRRPLSPFYGGLIILLATLAVYGPVMRGAGFVWDDDTILTGNPLVRAADGLSSFWLTTKWSDYFPLTMTSFWLEWRLWGLKPQGYHVVNVLLHAFSSVFLWRALRHLRVPGAWWAAVLFALHPVNVESVAWIAERKNTLAMFFCSLSLLFYLRSDANPHPSAFKSQSRCYWFSLLAFLLALLSKTAVVALPVVLLGCAWWLRRRITAADLRRSLPFLALSFGLGLVTIWFQYHRAIAGAHVHEASIYGRIAAAGWAVWFYLYKALWPANLSFVYPQWQIDPGAILSYLPGLACVALLGVFWRYRRGWGRPCLFAFGCYVAMLFPVLGFFKIFFFRYSLVADHYQYFSLIAVLALGVGLLVHFHKRPGAYVLPVLALVLAVASWRQGLIYTNPQTLWTDTLARNPRAWIAHVELGVLCLREGSRLAEAEHHFRRALELCPACDEACHNLGRVYAERKDFARALSCFKEALRLNPEVAETQADCGTAALALGRKEEARTHFRQALRLCPTDLYVARQLAALEPGDLDAQQALGEALAAAGKVAEANAHCAAVCCRRAAQLSAQGKTAEAIQQWRQALKLQPDNPGMLNNLAWLLATCPDDALRNGPEAVRLAERACALSGTNSPARLDTLAAAYAAAGRFADALAAEQKAIALAESSGPQDLLPQLRLRLEAFRASRPWREP